MTKILLVEDDKSLREIYGVRLLAEGYDIISAGDGEEALAMAIKDRPALIVSDVMMPKISGFDMLDILRSTTETKDIKVIMMTALSSDDQRQRGVALGADRYLVKSQVGIEDVVRTVHEVLGDAPVTTATTPSESSPAHAPATSTPSTPQAPHAPQPTPPAQQHTSSAAPQTPPSTSLPQPTAPFSTNRPASLGDRIINPLPPSAPPKDYTDMMNNELESPSSPPAPTPTTPQPAPVPTQPTSPTPPNAPPQAPAPPHAPAQPMPSPTTPPPAANSTVPPTSPQAPATSAPPTPPPYPPPGPAGPSGV